jgi:hypothetical protein
VKSPASIQIEFLFDLFPGSAEVIGVIGIIVIEDKKGVSPEWH